MTSDYNVKASGLLAATTGTQLISGKGGGVAACFHGGYAISDGTNTCVVTVYHGTAATAGTEVASFSIPASTVTPQALVFNIPISCPNGIYYVVTGTGAKANIFFSLGD